MVTPKLYKPIATATGRRPRLQPFPIVALVVVALFFAAPWSFEHKAHAALHGLCAQRPSHSFSFDGRFLPFDGRMTGIYGGFLATSVYLAVRGRYRSFRLPTIPVLAILGLFVAALAVDGTNALLVDLRLWHPYEPDNRLRLATGLGTGIALAVLVCFVLSTSLWRRGRWDVAPVRGVRELPLLVAVQAPLAVAFLSGAGWLYVPLSLLLLTAAVLVVGALMLIPVVLFRYGDRAFNGVGQLQNPATAALVLAVAVMAGISAGRFLLERVTNAPPLT